MAKTRFVVIDGVRVTLSQLRAAAALALEESGAISIDVTGKDASGAEFAPIEDLRATENAEHREAGYATE